MTKDEIKTYKRLKRQLGEKQRRLYDQGTYGRIVSRKPTGFNNKLKEMQEFINTAGSEAQKVKWSAMTPII